MDAQTLIVIAIAALAAFYLARRLWRNAQGEGDGACDKCTPIKDAKRGR